MTHNHDWTVCPCHQILCLTIFASVVLHLSLCYLYTCLVSIWWASVRWVTSVLPCKYVCILKLCESRHSRMSTWRITLKQCLCFYPFFFPLSSSVELEKISAKWSSFLWSCWKVQELYYLLRRESPSGHVTLLFEPACLNRKTCIAYI